MFKPVEENASLCLFWAFVPGLSLKIGAKSEATPETTVRTAIWDITTCSLLVVVVDLSVGQRRQDQRIDLVAVPTTGWRAYYIFSLGLWSVQTTCLQLEGFVIKRMIDEDEIIDINEASPEEWEMLPGIGRHKAQAIVEYRESLGGRFLCVEDLNNVPGISRPLFDSIVPQLLHRSLPRERNSGHIQSKGMSLRSTPSPSSSFSKPILKRKTFLKFDKGSLPSSQKKQKPQGCEVSDSFKQEFNVKSSTSSNYLNYPLPSCALPAETVRRRLPSKVSGPPAALQPWLDDFLSWNNEERTSSLDSLVELCDMSLIRHLMAKIEPLFQRDFISLLPKELALYVLSFIDPKDLCRAAQTCKYWRILAEDTLLWREKCKEYEVEVEAEDVPSQILVIHKSSQESNASIDMQANDIPYKNIFLKQLKVEMNWRHRPVRTPKHLKGHDDHVITCLQFDGNRIVSGSDDNTLKVWSAVTGNIIRTLVGHTGGVWSSQLKGNIVVSGSTDRTLRVWDTDSGECTHVLYGHTSTVRCLAMFNNIVVSGSRDGTLRVWDTVHGECQHVLVGHAAAVRCVQYDGKRVVSGAYDYLVKVWDPESETCLHTLSGHSNRVYSLQFDGRHIVSGSLDTSIRVWDAENGQLQHTLLGHQSLTSGMVLKNNTLVSGNADSTVKIWDIVSGQCLHTLAGPNKHQSAVTSLQFNNKFVITSSDDGSVKLWDLKTGEFVRDLVKLDSGGSGGVVWRVKCNDKKLVCAVGSRNGTEETKLFVLDFDVY
eukprot:gene15616-17191_t